MLENLIRQVKPDLSIKSVKQYISTLNNMLKHFETADINIFENYNDIIKYINTKNSYLTKRNYLNSIIVLLKHNEEKYKDTINKYIEIRDKYNEQYKAEQATNKKSIKQEKNWITLEKIKKILIDLEQNLDQEQNRIWYFMLNFWLNYPIRNDLQYTELISKKRYNNLLNAEIQKKNYFVLDHEPFLSISQYKTYKKYGVKKIFLNDEMKKILIKYLSHNPTKYILYNMKDKSPMSSSDITKSFTSLFRKYYPEKSISTNILRHVITTEKFGKTLDEMLRMAKIMGHSPSTQQQIYIKK